MGRFELKRLTDYSDESLINELRRVVANRSATGPLTKQEYKNLPSRVSGSTLQKRFGSWAKALQLAGLGHLSIERHMPYKARLQRGSQMTEKELISELKDAFASSGSLVLTVREFNKHSKVHYDVIRKRFGNWKAALMLAGIPQAELGKRYSEQECFDNIIRLWTHFGRQPHYHELCSVQSTVGPKAYVLRWGSWRKALEAFVLWANSEERQPSAEAANPTKKSTTEHTAAVFKAATPPENRRDIPLKLKWQVHLRDRFRCVACGRSPATDLTVELHADHIMAWADGGRTILENLQTLCRECNLGKGKSYGKAQGAANPV